MFFNSYNIPRQEKIMSDKMSLAHSDALNLYWNVRAREIAARRGEHGHAVAIAEVAEKFDDALAKTVQQGLDAQRDKRE